VNDSGAPAAMALVREARGDAVRRDRQRALGAVVVHHEERERHELADAGAAGVVESGEHGERVDGAAAVGEHGVDAHGGRVVEAQHLARERRAGAERVGHGEA
jgi:hypothetical protein